MSIQSVLLAAAISVASLPAAYAAPIELILNGGFETGSLSAWTVNSTAEYANNFYAITNGGNVPGSNHPTALNPTGGNFVAVSGQYGAGGETLSQTFTKTADITSLVLSFDWFDNTHANFSGTAIDGSQQVGRVDILAAGSGAFDVGTGVISNLLLNAGMFTNFGTTIPWVHSSFDLSNLAAGTYQLRFANGQISYYQEFGVDNVSLQATVPEPSTVALLGLSLLSFAASRRRVAKK